MSNKTKNFAFSSKNNLLLPTVLTSEGERKVDALPEREAALTHVSIRDAELGWRHITREEASALFPKQTVSANDRVFMCELCGQYVPFANPSNDKQRYFMHNRGEENKNCEERALRSNRYPKPQMGRYLFPLKILFDSFSQSFSLAIGIPRIEEFTADAQVAIIGEEQQPHSFFLTERMRDIGITWLNLGQDISCQYTIRTSGFQTTCWPGKVPGINPDGAVFDGGSGEMLYPGDEVDEVHTYYLLTDSKPPDCRNIHCTEVKRQTAHGKIWSVYRIKATAFSSDTVRYFLLLHMHLVKKKMILTLLWPPTVKMQGTAFHNSDTIYVAHNGNKDLRLLMFPTGQQMPQQQNGYFCVESNGFQQMAAVQYHDGQRSQSNHTMLWKGIVTEDKAELEVKISDRNGTPLTESVYTKLPAKSFLRILAPFDGKIIIVRGNKVYDIQTIKSEELKTIEVTFGETIKFLQGNDVVKTITFRRSHQEQDKPFMKILLQLLRQPTIKYVQVRHTLGNVMDRIPVNVELKQELYVCIQKGKMPMEAYRYLIDYLANHK